MLFGNPVRAAGALWLYACTAGIAQAPQSAPRDAPSKGSLVQRGPARDAERRGPQVSFNVVALDARGGPLRDLRDADLTIYDDGKRMPVSFCRPLETAGGPAPMGPREFSNRTIGGGADTTLVLLDLLNQDLAERGFAWNSIAGAFQKMDPGQQVYLYLLTKDGSLYPLRAFPGAESRPEPEEPGWAARVPALLDQAMNAVNELRPMDFQMDPDARVRQTLAILQELSSYLAVQLGRKSLVWVSHGVPLFARSAEGLWRDYTPLFQGLASDLARSGIAVYAVDQEQRDAGSLESRAMLQQLAGLTGGFWLPNNAERAIQQAAGEGPATYRVGYVPPPGRWDNKFHKLRVIAERQGKRLRVRAPQGYFGDARRADPVQRLALAALGPVDEPGIGIRAVVTPSQQAEGWLHFQVRVYPADLQLTPGEISTGEFRLMLAYDTDSWQADDTRTIETPVRLTPENREREMRDGVEVSFDRPLPGGARKVRIVVSDRQSGAVGSLSVPLVAPSRQ